ncbi:winged helix-turn-helix transcriptional regulator [Nonomuraea ferruginea]
MGSSYHQFCPVAKAVELLGERWTLLVIRELVCGTERFNELRRGLPRMSPPRCCPGGCTSSPRQASWRGTSRTTTCDTS